MTSRLKLAAKAVRPALPARAVFSGPPGAGKTRTALIVATVLADGGDILFIDTEQESALTYADDFAFTHLPFRPPYDPRDLAATLVEAGDQYAVIIVDSLTHFWRAEGGVLDIAGGKFSNWKDARPVHETMVQAFLTCKAHFIGCARSKVEHVQETDPRSGKQVVRKVGMAVVQDDSLEYELNVACELDMDHSFVVSKSRTVAVPVGRVYKPEQAEQFAEDYRDWLKGGEPPAPAEFVDELRARMDALPEAVRKDAKRDFVASLGRPDTLPESRMAAADELVARWEAQAPEGDTTQDEQADEPAIESGGGDAGPPSAVASPGVPAPDRAAPPAGVEPAAPSGGVVGTAPAGSTTAPGGKDATGGEAGETLPSATTEPAPSGGTLKDANPSGYNSLNRWCRGKAKDWPDDLRRVWWEALAWAVSGGRTTHLGELTPDEAGLFRSRVGDHASGRARWVETDDPQFLGWTLTSEEAA